MTVTIGLCWIQTFSLVVARVGLGHSADGLGWIGSHKMDPWLTLTRSTQPCIHPESTNRVDLPASAGVRTEISELSGGR